MDIKNTMIKKKAPFLMANSLLVSCEKENNKGIFNRTSPIPSPRPGIGNQGNILLKYYNN
ncbi:MAG TPA: hypothetical protein DCW46_04660 [Desulfotomaculum sp.]|nr:hypothetical protein [Desulfotomaculum sp.]